MIYFVHHYEIPALNRIHPVVVQRPQRQVHVRARPLSPSDVETAQMNRANFTQINSTVLQPVVPERELSQQSSNEVIVEPQDTDSESSSNSSDSLPRSGLHQSDEFDSSEGFVDSPSSSSAAGVSVEESGLFGSQLSHSDLRQARLRHLQKDRNT